jgi:hypothetical protein
MRLRKVGAVPTTCKATGILEYSVDFKAYLGAKKASSI